MGQVRFPDWEPDFVDEVIRAAEARLARERRRASTRALQLAREQAYHRLAVALDRPPRREGAGHGQLTLFPTNPTLFDVDE